MNAELVGGREFLERYFRDCDGTNIELRALHIVKNAPSKVVHQKGYTDLDALLADAEKLSKRYNVFFNTVALNGGFTEDHAVACPALRIDIDFKNGITEAEALEMLAAFPLPPSAIIRTGGGLHVYWFLAELAGREDFPRVKAIIKSLIFSFRADTGAKDIPRVLRLPGTVNRKPEYNPPRPVTLARADWHPEREYRLSDFAALLPIEGEIKVPPAEKMKMAEAAGDKLPIARLAAVFDKCTELDGMRRNAIEAGRLLPESKPGEHLARIRMMNLYRAFAGGPERAVQEIFSHLDDYNARETEKQTASLHASPPPCVELCPAGQCEAIKTLGKRSPIAFAYPTRTATAPAVPATEAAPLEKFRAKADVMGTFAQSTEISTFLTARRDAVRNDIASLVGARLVTASEPEDGQTFDEGLIKILTGQDKTKARFLFRESFEFSATFKLWLQGNHRPHIRSTGGAMWRRLLIVPFTRTVPEERRDKTLGDKLRTPEERDAEEKRNA